MTPQSLLAPARLAGQPVLRSQSDERLVDLVRAGSEPAFEAIVARYRRPLQRYCARFLPEERAEDVVQQAFVNAYGAMRGSSAEISLRPWLYRIAHNAALNALRDRGLGHAPLDDQYDGVERPDQALERQQGLRDVIAAVQELPDRQRDAIVLRELEGRSYEEIAGELGVTGGAVRQLLNRARSTLRAGVTAVTPVGLLARIPAAYESQPLAERVAEISTGAGASAVAAKVGVAALATGAVAGGVAVAPKGEDADRASARDRAAERREAKPLRALDRLRPGREVRPGSNEPRSPRHEGGRGSGGSGSGDADPVGDRSGTSGSSGPGSGGEEDRSGSNSGSDSDSSGSGSSGSGSSGSGSSGSGSSGSGSSGSGSGSSGSGSGISGSGSGDGTSGSGSGSSGSGEDYDNSGSGSSGSG